MKAAGPACRPRPMSRAGPRTPWIMTVPLVVLAIAAVLGGGINFPVWHMDFLSRFLSPLFPAVDRHPHEHRDQMGAVPADHGGGVDRPRLGPHRPGGRPSTPRSSRNFLRRAWYFDDLVSATVSGPLRLAASGLAFVVDRRVVDGAGQRHWLAPWARPAGCCGGLQTGYLRNYALGIGVGLVILLAYLTFRVGN